MIVTATTAASGRSETSPARSTITASILLVDRAGYAATDWTAAAGSRPTARRRCRGTPVEDGVTGLPVRIPVPLVELVEAGPEGRGVGFVATKENIHVDGKRQRPDQGDDRHFLEPGVSKDGHREAHGAWSTSRTQIGGSPQRLTVGDPPRVIAPKTFTRPESLAEIPARRGQHAMPSRTPRYAMKPFTGGGNP